MKKREVLEQNYFFFLKIPTIYTISKSEYIGTLGQKRRFPMPSAGLAKQSMPMKVNDFVWDFIPLNRDVVELILDRTQRSADACRTGTDDYGIVKIRIGSGSP